MQLKVVKAYNAISDQFGMLLRKVGLSSITPAELVESFLGREDLICW